MPYSCLNNYAKIKYLLSNFTGFIYIYVCAYIHDKEGKAREGEGRGGERREGLLVILVKLSIL